MPHVLPCSYIGYVGGTADYVSPQCQHALPLNELYDNQQALHSVSHVLDKRTWSRPTGLFPRARSRDGGLDATVAYLRSIPSVVCGTLGSAESDNADVDTKVVDGRLDEALYSDAG